MLASVKNFIFPTKSVRLLEVLKSNINLFVTPCTVLDPETTVGLMPT
jgi:hypothetical protein